VNSFNISIGNTTRIELRKRSSKYNKSRAAETQLKAQQDQSCGNAAQSTTRVELRKRSSKHNKNRAAETQLKVEEE